jgi:hypothetical protein
MILMSLLFSTWLPSSTAQPHHCHDVANGPTQQPDNSDEMEAGDIIARGSV